MCRGLESELHCKFTDLYGLCRRRSTEGIHRGGCRDAGIVFRAEQVECLPDMRNGAWHIAICHDAKARPLAEELSRIDPRSRYWCAVPLASSAEVLLGRVSVDSSDLLDGFTATHP